MKNNFQFLISLILIFSTFAFVRTLSQTEAIPLRMPFKEFPLNMGKWVGEDKRFSKQTEETLRATDYMNRLYTDGSGRQIRFYVGYFESQKVGEIAHSPRHCLPGSGWRMEGGETLRVSFKGFREDSIKVNKYLIRKGLEKQLLLYWYQERGRTLTNEYIARLYLIWDAITRGRTDGALVEVMTPINPSEEAALKRQVEFIQLAMPLLSRHLPR